MKEILQTRLFDSVTDLNEFLKDMCPAQRVQSIQPVYKEADTIKSDISGGLSHNLSYKIRVWYLVTYRVTV